MPKALFMSINLLGDSISISPALRAWHRLNPEYSIDLLTLPDAIAELYLRMGVPLRVLTDAEKTEGPYDFEFNFDVNKAFAIGDAKKIHIIDAYAQMLLGPDHGQQIDPTPTFETVEEDHPQGLMLISPFSRSCASQKGLPPNKMVPWPCWLQIMSLLRDAGPIGVLGGKDDHAPLPIAENEYFCGLSFNQVALILRDARLLVTIDNGIAHLASSQRTPMLEFYPACLGLHWVAPAGNPKAVIAQADPAKLHPSPAVMAVRRAMQQLIGKKV